MAVIVAQVDKTQLIGLGEIIFFNVGPDRFGQLLLPQQIKLSFEHWF